MKNKTCMFMSITAAALAAYASFGATVVDDGIKDGVHGYTPKRYVQPPQPDGRLPHQAVERIEALGAWLKVNGEAIYETRPLPPFRKGDWAFTRNRKTGAEYAIRLWQEGETCAGRQTIPGVEAAKIVHVWSGREFVCEKTADGPAFDLPADIKGDPNADVFKMVR